MHLLASPNTRLADTLADGERPEQCRRRTTVAQAASLSVVGRPQPSDARASRGHQLESFRDLVGASRGERRRPSASGALGGQSQHRHRRSFSGCHHTRGVSNRRAQRNASCAANSTLKDSILGGALTTPLGHWPSRSARFGNLDAVGRLRTRHRSGRVRRVPQSHDPGWAAYARNTGVSVFVRFAVAAHRTRWLGVASPALAIHLASARCRLARSLSRSWRGRPAQAGPARPVPPAGRPVLG